MKHTGKFIFSLCGCNEEDDAGEYKGMSIVWVCMYRHRDTTAESSTYDHIYNGYYLRITAKNTSNHIKKHLFDPKPLLNIRIYHLDCLLYFV